MKYIVQCRYSVIGERPFWHDLIEYNTLHSAKDELVQYKKTYRRNKDYRWRIISRVEMYKKIEKVIK